MIDLVQEKIAAAKRRDADAAKWLIDEFCATVNQNRQKTPEGKFKLTSDGKRIPHVKPSGTHTQFHEELLDYLAECFERIGDFEGESGNAKRVNADVALNLAGFGKRGPKPSPETRAESLRRGMAAWQRHRNGAESLEVIYAELAKIENQSESTIERDYKEFNKLVNSLGM